MIRHECCILELKSHRNNLQTWKGTFVYQEALKYKMYYLRLVSKIWSVLSVLKSKHDQDFSFNDLHSYIMPLEQKQKKGQKNCGLSGTWTQTTAFLLQLLKRHNITAKIIKIEIV